VRGSSTAMILVVGSDWIVMEGEDGSGRGQGCTRTQAQWGTPDLADLAPASPTLCCTPPS